MEELLRNEILTSKEIAKQLGVHCITISRWRKKLGIKVKIGSKKGKPKPWASKTSKGFCLECGNTIKIIPSYIPKFCSRVCLHKNPIYKNTLKNMDKSYMQTEKYRNSLTKHTTPEYKRYTNRVHKLTSKTYQKYKKEINPNGYKRTLAGVECGYHLDHKISIKFGFKNKMKPEELAIKENLQMLPWKENVSKGSK